MSRQLRIQHSNALYHIMSRGIARRDIVADDLDRDRWVETLRSTVELFRWHLYSFTLMTNHYHLFLSTPDPNLSKGMRELNGGYAAYFNHRHRHGGHVFQGRFKAHLVETEGHYLEISRYIHLNPVRARLVPLPEQWAWSSYAGYFRQSKQLQWLDYARVLREFGSQPGTARRRYRRFVLAGINDRPGRPWDAAKYDLIIGSDRFVMKIRQLIKRESDDPERPQLRQLRSRPSLETIVQRTAAAFRTDPGRWAPGRRSDDTGRAVAAYVARRVFAYGVGEIASAVGYKGPSSVSRALQRVDEGSEDLKKKAARIGQQLARD